jgi:hypothetical protein
MRMPRRSRVDKCVAPDARNGVGQTGAWRELDAYTRTRTRRPHLEARHLGPYAGVAHDVGANNEPVQRSHSERAGLTIR